MEVQTCGQPSHWSPPRPDGGWSLTFPSWLKEKGAWWRLAELAQGFPQKMFMKLRGGAIWQKSPGKGKENSAQSSRAEGPFKGIRLFLGLEKRTIRRARYFEMIKSTQDALFRWGVLCFQNVIIVKST